MTMNDVAGRGASLPYDPYSGRYGYCTGHVASENGALVYVHPGNCPLHPREQAQALWERRQAASLTDAEEREYQQLKARAYRTMRRGN